MVPSKPAGESCGLVDQVQVELLAAEGPLCGAEGGLRAFRRRGSWRGRPDRSSYPRERLLQLHASGYGHVSRHHGDRNPCPAVTNDVVEELTFLADALHVRRKLFGSGPIVLAANVDDHQLCVLDSCVAICDRPPLPLALPRPAAGFAKLGDELGRYVLDKLEVSPSVVGELLSSGDGQKLDYAGRLGKEPLD